ncbi:cytochrome aa3 quinol oxidase subunit IV [Fredinandcohnia quinoae]|uniref:Quinol oxidase subunit 4 n=1 Tax=Fredinandcohnia quinoae TaxID=2918902 RepID=A0AAW5DZ59_9BACI|nr:cytochrome aa3 quinol oxidase subunit IV [Fredinandcohnia sp. SECRCQ15]MCH1624305.1 cytochrome aa3 quinol oxidase subunit IV [Fredinandcohnia sp. SECRCQ15]
MKELFPRKQIMGFVSSLILTAVALVVYFMDMSFTAGITVLIITAFIQAALQLVVFMHAGETDDKGAIYANVYFMMVIAIVTVFGTLLLFLWDM